MTQVREAFQLAKVNRLQWLEDWARQYQQRQMSEMTQSDQAKMKKRLYNEIYARVCLVCHSIIQMMFMSQ